MRGVHIVNYDIWKLIQTDIHGHLQHGLDIPNSNTILMGGLAEPSHTCSEYIPQCDCARGRRRGYQGHRGYRKQRKPRWSPWT